MPYKKAKKRHGYTTIALKQGNIDILSHIENEFREMVPNRVTWGSFFEQCALMFEALYVVPSVKAIRLNKYMYGAECPNCGEGIKSPLKRLTRIVWKQKCSKCGTIFIALA